MAMGFMLRESWASRAIKKCHISPLLTKAALSQSLPFFHPDCQSQSAWPYGIYAHLANTRSTVHVFGTRFFTAFPQVTQNRSTLVRKPHLRT